MLLFQRSGNNSTNVQIGHISVDNSVHTTIYISENRLGLAKNSEDLQIENIHYDNVVPLLTGFYQLSSFYVVAHVKHIGESYFQKSHSDSSVKQVSSVTFTDNAGKDFRGIVPVEQIRFTPKSKVVVAFAYNKRDNLLCFYVHDVASTESTILSFGPVWNFFSNMEKFVTFSFAPITIVIVLNFYFQIHFFTGSLILKVWIIYVVALGFFIVNVCDIRKRLIHQVIAKNVNKILSKHK